MTSLDVYLIEMLGWAVPLQHTPIKEIGNLINADRYPSLQGIFYAAFGYAMLFGVLRTILTRLLFNSLAVSSMDIKEDWLASSDFIRDPTINAMLMPLVRKIEKDDEKGVEKRKVLIDAFCEENKGGHTYANVNRYLIDIQKADAVQLKVTKFVESVWRFAFYLVFVIFEYYVLFVENGTAPWILDTKLHWKGWPAFGSGAISELNKLLYKTQLGCYIHQLIWTEVSRKDAVEMIIHHIATILLITFSWACNYTRIGSSILLVHDIADIFLEGGKCIVYVSKVKGQEWAKIVSDILLGIFAVTFAVSRLYYFPKYMVLSLIYEAPVEYGGTWAGYYFFAGLLTTLLCLHCFWFFLIVKMVIKTLLTGVVEKDERSDDEGDCDPDDAPIATKKNK